VLLAVGSVGAGRLPPTIPKAKCENATIELIAKPCKYFITVRNC
jgi:hypothetical protein